VVHFFAMQRALLQCWKQNQNLKTKSRPRPVWGRSCHKTAVSNPKSGCDRLFQRRPTTTY